jgi:mono/diheme cytochrome c family protein
MSHALVVPLDSSITSLDHMRGGIRVAVEATGVADFYLGYQDVKRGLYRKPPEIVAEVAKGGAAAALLWLPVASWLVRSHPSLRVIPVRHAELEYPIGVGIRRRDGDLSRAVDAAVARLTESGRAREILLRYGAIPSPPASRRPSPFVLAQATDPVEAGRSLFSTACSRCHGAEGAGGGLGGAVPVIRNYDGGQEKFIRVVRDGRRNTPMAPFRGILTNEEIVTIYQYLTSRPRP